MGNDLFCTKATCDDSQLVPLLVDPRGVTHIGPAPPIPPVDEPQTADHPLPTTAPALPVEPASVEPLPNPASSQSGGTSQSSVSNQYGPTSPSSTLSSSQAPPSPLCLVPDPSSGPTPARSPKSKVSKPNPVTLSAGTKGRKVMPFKTVLQPVKSKCVKSVVTSVKPKPIDSTFFSLPSSASLDWSATLVEDPSVSPHTDAQKVKSKKPATLTKPKPSSVKSSKANESGQSETNKEGDASGSNAASSKDEKQVREEEEKQK